MMANYNFIFFSEKEKVENYNNFKERDFILFDFFSWYFVYTIHFTDMGDCYGCALYHDKWRLQCGWFKISINERDFLLQLMPFNHMHLNDQENIVSFCESKIWKIMLTISPLWVGKLKWENNYVRGVIEKIIMLQVFIIKEMIKIIIDVDISTALSGEFSFV